MPRGLAAVGRAVLGPAARSLAALGPAAFGMAALGLALGVAACDRSESPRRPTLAEQRRAGFHAGPRDVMVYFARPESCAVSGFARHVAGDTPVAVVRAALDSLLAGPHDDERAAGWISAIPDTAETRRHLTSHRAFHLEAGHDGGPVEIRDLRELPDGTLLVDFTAPMRAYDHGRTEEMPLRLCSLMRQLDSTVGQFGWWAGTRYAIEGESKAAFQP
ncbi:MAG: hypothetical protein R3B81_15455 [bacterium]